MSRLTARFGSAATIAALTGACGGAQHPNPDTNLAPPVTSASSAAPPMGSGASRLEREDASTDAELRARKSEKEQRTVKLDEAEQTLEIAMKARDAAVQGVTADPTSKDRQDEFRARAEDVRAAARERNGAKCALQNAEEQYDTTYYKYERARRWLHGIALSGSVAHSASDRTLAGGMVRYLHRFSPAQTFELGLGYHDVKQPEQDDAAATSLRARLGFGREHAVFFIGVGGGALDVSEDSRRYAALGELGLAFRLGHHTHPDGWGSPFADARVFVMPWLPFDGSSGAVLFGVELGAGIGFINARNYQSAPPPK